MPKDWRFMESFDGDDDAKKLETLENISDDDDEMPDTMTPRVVNIVATVNLGCEFDLFNIATMIRNAEYNPRRFQAVIVTIQEPRATGLIFRNGKVNIVGCKTEESAGLAARKFGRIIRKLGYPVKFRSFEVKNMVAVIDCKFPVRLQSLASERKYRPFTTYNPEIFAGVIFRIPEPRVTLLIFASGKIVMTAARNKEMLEEAAEWVYRILQMFNKETEPLPVEEPQEAPKETPVEIKPDPAEVKPEPKKKKRDPFKKPPKS